MPIDPVAFAQALRRAITKSIAPIVRHGGDGQHSYRKVAQIAKLTHKFIKDGNPTRHLEVFDQVYEALGEQNEVAKTNTFSLTLDGKARDWPQGR